MVDGPAVAAIGIGSVFVYAGIKGKSVLATVQSVITGTGPASTTQTTGIEIFPTVAKGDTFSDVPPPLVNSKGSPQQILKETAAHFGWGTGAEWQALQSLEMGEAGFNPKKPNPSSGAYGMAQSLGHHFSGGPAPNGVNEYGGQGLTPAQSRAASMGDPVQQSQWMCTYIKGQYGTPSNAYRQWLSRHPHWY